VLRFFQSAPRTDIGADALGYLARRGVTAAEIEGFRLGYSPAERHALKAHLAAKGFALDEMITAGMAVAGEDIPVAYDRFRGRLMFPIAGMQGRVIAFGGRALDAVSQPKYLNSPDTPLFHKGAVLFNAAHARLSKVSQKHVPAKVGMATGFGTKTSVKQRTLSSHALAKPGMSAWRRTSVAPWSPPRAIWM
jgi:DNA primase